MEEENKESEFGKGLVYNLVLFANHFSTPQAENLNHIQFFLKQSPEKQSKILEDNPDPSHNYGWNKEVKWWFNKIVPIYGNPEQALSSNIETWANGATDHLYEIEIPEKWKAEKIGKLIAELQDKGLSMGHGFTGQIWTHDDLMELQNMTKEIAKLIDNKLGIEVLTAQWE